MPVEVVVVQEKPSGLTYPLWFSDDLRDCSREEREAFVDKMLLRARTTVLLYLSE